MNKLNTPFSSTRNPEEFQEIPPPQGFKSTRGIAGRLLAAQEEERRRISRDLHDEVNQRIAVLCFKIQSLQASLLPSSQPFKALQELYDELALLSEDLRHFAHQLHPSILRDLGLSRAIQALVYDVGKREEISISLEDKLAKEPLPEEVACCVYRLAQEALQNMVKHAQASHAWITLEKNSRGLRLSIVDDGKGFEPRQLHFQSPGLGFVGMRERVQLLGGQLRIGSAPGQGATIQVFLPLKRKRVTLKNNHPGFTGNRLVENHLDGSTDSFPKNNLRSDSPVGVLAM